MSTLYDDVSFIVRNKNRRLVFEALDEPKIPTRLSKELKVNIGFVSNILIELLQRKLIVCLNPNEKRHRYYKRTPKGNNVLKEIAKIKE